MSVNLNITGKDRRGTEYTLPMPFWLTLYRDIDAPADALTLTFLDREIPEVCMIEITGDITFSGVVDTITHTRDKSGDKTVMICRSLAAILLDSEALPGNRKNPTIESMLLNCDCAGKIKGFLYDSYTPISSLTLSKGTSTWRFLTLFCEQTMGHSPRITRDLYFSAQPYSTQIKHDFDSLTVNGVEKSVDFSDVITSVSIRNEEGTYSTMMMSPYLSLPFFRHRYIIPGAGWVNFPLEAGRRTLKQSMLRYHTTTLSLPDFYNADLGDGAKYEGEEKCVIALRYKLDQSGVSTEVTLGEREYIE